MHLKNTHRKGESLQIETKGKLIIYTPKQHIFYDISEQSNE